MQRLVYHWKLFSDNCSQAYLTETACMFSRFRDSFWFMIYLKQPTWIRINGNQGEENCHIIFRDVFIDWHLYTYIDLPFPNHSKICFGTIYRNQLTVAVAVLMAHKPEIEHSVDIGVLGTIVMYEGNFIHISPATNPSKYYQVAIIIWLV